MPGVEHITEMARMGHASLSLHPLGYGPSDPVDGTAVCFGTYADQVQQVVDQLHARSYTMDGRAGPGSIASRSSATAAAG